MFLIPNDQTESRPKTCWSNITPFQMGLILILCVAVTFLIAIVIVYILSLSIWSHSEKCSDMYDMLSYWKLHRQAAQLSMYPDYGPSDPDRDCGGQDCGEHKYDVPKPSVHPPTNSGHIEIDVLDPNAPPKIIPKEPKPETTNATKGKRSSLCSEMPAIGVLLENLYSDDNEQIIKCPVAIISENWVLTLAQCLDNNKFYTFSVRVNSHYWSKEGNLKKISRAISNDNLVAIHLQENLSKSECIENVVLSQNTFDVGYAFYWDEGNLTYPLKKRSKHGKMKQASVKFLATENFFIYDDVKNECFGGIGAVLLDENRSLIGFQTSTICKESWHVPYVSIAKYFDWLQAIRRVV